MSELRKTLFNGARLMVISFVFLLSASLMFVPVKLQGSDTESRSEEAKITLNLDNIQLKNVADDIHKQTGFTLLFSESLVSLPVSGIYKDVSIDEFLRRVLKGKNISVLFDDTEKLFVVKAFGDKAIVAHNESISQEKLNEMVPGMNLTFEELGKQEQANKLAMDEALNNPDTLDPVSGVTLGEGRRQEEANKMALHEALTSPETIVPHSGDLTMKQVSENEENNRKELARLMDEQNTVDPVTGLKLSELRRIEAENKRLLEEALKNPDTIDPMTGLTLRELRAQENN